VPDCGTLNRSTLLNGKLRGPGVYPRLDYREQFKVAVGTISPARLLVKVAIPGRLSGRSSKSSTTTGHLRPTKRRWDRLGASGAGEPRIGGAHDRRRGRTRRSISWFWSCCPRSIWRGVRSGSPRRISCPTSNSLPRSNWPSCGVWTCISFCPVAVRLSSLAQRAAVRPFQINDD
jgi:hypothetical protein